MTVYFWQVDFRLFCLYILTRVLKLEKLLTLMARLPDDSIFAAKLQQFVIDIRELSLFYVGYWSFRSGTIYLMHLSRSKTN
jgi:hypothetical protein